MKRYKLTTKKLTTHYGHQWEVGVEQVISKPGNVLCSDQVFHFYDSPEVAVLLNPTHANITNPLLWEVSCDEVAHDGVKGGAKHMTLIKKVKAPRFTKLQKQVFAIKCALAVYRAKDFTIWANDFLSGKDRSARPAYAAYAADAAADTAARAAYAAADTAYAKKIRKAINAAAKFAANFKG